MAKIREMQGRIQRESGRDVKVRRLDDGKELFIPCNQTVTIHRNYEMIADASVLLPSDLAFILVNDILVPVVRADADWID